jgi:hypothetical protein
VAPVLRPVEFKRRLNTTPRERLHRAGSRKAQIQAKAKIIELLAKLKLKNERTKLMANSSNTQQQSNKPSFVVPRTASTSSAVTTVPKQKFSQRVLANTKKIFNKPIIFRKSTFGPNQNTGLNSNSNLQTKVNSTRPQIYNSSSRGANSSTAASTASSSGASVSTTSRSTTSTTSGSGAGSGGNNGLGNGANRSNTTNISTNTNVTTRDQTNKLVEKAGSNEEEPKAKKPEKKEFDWYNPKLGFVTKRVGILAIIGIIGVIGISLFRLSSNIPEGAKPVSITPIIGEAARTTQFTSSILSYLSGINPIVIILVLASLFLLFPRKK